MDARYLVGIDLHKDVIQMCALEVADRTLLEECHEIETLEQDLAVMASLMRWARSGRSRNDAIDAKHALVNTRIRRQRPPANARRAKPNDP